MHDYEHLPMSKSTDGCDKINEKLNKQINDEVWNIINFMQDNHLLHLESTDHIYSSYIL